MPALRMVFVLPWPWRWAGCRLPFCLVVNVCLYSAFTYSCVSDIESLSWVGELIGLQPGRVERESGNVDQISFSVSRELR